MVRTFDFKHERRKKREKDLLALGQKRHLDVCEELDGERIDKYLAAMTPWLSRHTIQKRIEAGTVSLNGRTVKASARVRAGDTVLVDLPRPPAVVEDTHQIPLDVIHEDAFLLVINKQPHVVVHPSGRRLSGTLIQAVHYRYRRQMATGENIRPRLLHRLDRETSGVLAFSKSEAHHKDLAMQFERRTAQKEYVAVVEGNVEKDRGHIDFPIGEAASSDVFVKMEVRQDTGRPAHTEFDVLERFGDYTLMHLVPHTGRTHQLRVHLAAIGHPIVADQIYKDEQVFLDYVDRGLAPRGSHPLIDRHALHACRLTLDYGGERRTFEAPPTADFAALLANLRGEHLVE